MMKFFRSMALICSLLLPAFVISKTIDLEDSDLILVKTRVPTRGIVCSNKERAERVGSKLSNATLSTSSWGTQVYVGEYQGEEFFVALAPIGSGSGLVFTELFANGAEYIIRYGSDDIKSPEERDYRLIKAIDETDNLYGFNFASGVPFEDWGKSIFASDAIIHALEEEATSRGQEIERRVCHHLENYHAMRVPEKYGPRREVLEKQIKTLKRTDKKESIDMESAVLFRVAQDFDKHAASVLQTVVKNNPKLGPYEGVNRQEALAMENNIFIDYLFSALKRLPNKT
ncbi:hypothetical protein JYU14_03845 [Simkania negevensis]|uniref:Secreted protein n=1 Tax=Simkania negevensis TaxID=83561 RepID=A0ABS3AS26_9BACT|nr:hypothetical protein [Simkania negevensis]